MPKKETVCCFSGHRIIERSKIIPLSESLENTILKLISEGITHFVAGGALGFDTLCAKTVLYLKEKHPEISLTLVLPCRDQAKYWSDSQKALYENIKKQSDNIIYISQSYVDGCMQARNRALVDASGYLICYLKKNSGGTAYTVNYAKEKGLNIINLAEENRQKQMDI